MKFKIQILITCCLFLQTISTHAQKLDTASIISYIKQYKDIAIEEMKRSGIPASITLAQGIHESSYGTSYLSKNTNNHFGIKCKENWTGKTFKYTDDAPNECFRVYDSVIQSYRDHSDFLKYRPRYASLFLLDKYDYKNWAYGLKKAGYATNPQYAPILIKTIQDFQLYAFDKGENPSYLKTETPVNIEEDEEDDKNYNVTDSIEIAPTTKPTEEKKTEVVETSVEIAQQKPDFTRPVNKKITKINNVKSVKLYNGETLDLLANVLKIEKTDLLSFNDIKDESKIKVGQTIFIQRKKKSNAEGTYKVKMEDNIWSISQKKGIRLASLLKMNKLEEGEEPASKETIYLKGNAPEKPKLRIIKIITKEVDVLVDKQGKPIENAIIRANDTVYPTIQTPIVAASAVDSSRLLGWEKDTKLLEKPIAQIFPEKETVTTNPVIESKPTTTETIVVAEKPTPTIYPTSIDYNKLPKSSTNLHTVIKGDTMYNICKRYNISIAQIMEWNHLSDQSIKLGQTLKIQP